MTIVNKVNGNEEDILLTIKQDKNRKKLMEKLKELIQLYIQIHVSSINMIT